MGEISGLLATVPIEAWALFALGAGGRAARSLWPYARYHFHKARIARLSHQRYVSAREANGFHVAMGDEPALPPMPAVIGRALLEGLIAGGPAALIALQHDSEDWRLAGPFIGIALAIVTWRWLNDPERLAPWERTRVPREAIVGFAAAMVIVAALLGILIEFF